MICNNGLTSILAPLIEQFLLLKSTQIKAQDVFTRVLYLLDKKASLANLTEISLKKDLVLEVYKTYINSSLARGTLMRYCQVLREFSYFMVLHGFDAYYLEDPMYPPAKVKSYYIPSREQIIQFINHIDILASYKKEQEAVVNEH